MPELQTMPTPTRRECQEIPLDIVSEIRESSCAPLTTGLCVPKGELFEAGEWLLEGLGGAQIPAQTKVLNRWSDGSVRWLQARFGARRVSTGRTRCLLVRPEKRARQPTGHSTLTRQDGAIDISVQSDLRDASVCRSLSLIPQLLDAREQPLTIRMTATESEETGDVCSVTVVTATVVEFSFVQVTFRIEVWPTEGLIRVRTRIRNTRRARHRGGLWDLGDPGSFQFRGLHLCVDTSLSDRSEESSAPLIQWKAETDSITRVTAEPVSILQRGSGGASWANGHHRDQHGQSTVRNRGYRATSAAGTLRGHRSEPVISVVENDKQTSVAIPEFWQQFPSGLSASNGEVFLELFPTAAEETFELQGGEQKTHDAWISLQSDANVSHMDWVAQPPRLIQPADWIHETRVFSWLPEMTGQPSVAAGRFDKYVSDATTGDQSMEARRDRADEYGWRSFGDVHADHEQQHYEGGNTLASHYNNQFDLVFGGILNLAVSGNPAWFDLFEPLARHVMDIDIYHTAEDRACFNGGLFWHTDHFVDAHTASHRTYSKHNKAEHEDYGGGPSNEHNYTTGLLHYYFLTGDAEARDSVKSLADWVIAMDDGAQTIWGALDAGPTGLATQTVHEDFHGPGRGAGNSINALTDAWILTGDDLYQNRAEELIRRVTHPNHDCDRLELIDAEGHWSYTVCMLALGRYLEVKSEAGQFDQMYAWVRSSLENYGRWMAENERPTLSEPEKLRYPTVAWAAQDFRKANVLRIAAGCTDDVRLENAMRRKADDLNEAAWEDLYDFDDQHLTARCLSVVMTEGLRDVFHRSSRPSYMPPCREEFEWPAWQMFVPQKQRIRSMLRNPAKAILAAGRLCHPVRIAQTLKALRRQLL